MGKLKRLDSGLRKEAHKEKQKENGQQQKKWTRLAGPGEWMDQKKKLINPEEKFWGKKQGDFPFPGTKRKKEKQRSKSEIR